MIDILFASHLPSASGGAERALLEMLTYLKKQGFKNHVLIDRQGELSTELTQLGIDFTIVRLPWWAENANTGAQISLPSELDRIVDQIRQLNPKICATNSIVTPWLAYAAAITNKPHAWLIHEVGKLDNNFEYAVSDKHFFMTIDVLSNVVFFNSRSTTDFFMPHFKYAKNGGIIYPVKGALRPEKITSPYRNDVIKLVSVGRIAKAKNQLELIRAVEIIKRRKHDVQLVLVGQIYPDYQTDIEEYIDQHQLQENVTLAGQVNNPSSISVLADIFVTATSNEAFGRSTVEAMDLGIPVVGANAAGTAEIIQNGKTGLLYKLGDPQELADKIIKLYDDEKLRVRLITAAQQTVKSAYDEAVRYQPFLDYWQQLSQQPAAAFDLSPINSSLRTGSAFYRLFKR